MLFLTFSLQEDLYHSVGLSITILPNAHVRQPRSLSDYNLLLLRIYGRFRKGDIQLNQIEPCVGKKDVNFQQFHLV